MNTAASCLETTASKRRGIAALLAAGILCVLAPSASAQNQSKPKKARFYDFLGDNLKGDLVRPSQDLIVSGLGPRQHPSLIPLRKDFIDQILKSAEAVGPGAIRASRHTPAPKASR